MNHSDYFFDKMCREAMNELASGDKTWKEIDSNTLFLACFGMLNNHLTHKLTKPLWWVAGSAAAAVIGFFVNMLLS